MFIPTLVAVLLIAIAWLYKKFEYQDPALLAIPQPGKRVPILGNILSLDIRNYNRTLTEFYEKTGEKMLIMFAFNKPRIFLADAAAAAKVMNDDDLFKRQGDVFDHFAFTMDNALFTIDGYAWKQRRARLNHAFGPIKVRNLFSVISEKVNESFKVINELMEKQGYVDFDELFVKATADVIFQFLMSKNYNIMTSDPHRIDNYFKTLRDEGFMIIAIPFWKYLPAPSRIIFAFKRLKFQHFIEKEVRERIEQRRQAPGTPAVDTLDMLIDKGVSVHDIRVELIGLIFAGHDTTAHTMAFALLELTKPENKRVLDKLLQEIDSVIPPSDDHGRLHHVDDVNKLVYLSVVLKEVLRLYPIAMAHPREVQEDVEVAGYRIPKGNTILVHYYAMHRLSKYWPDPLVFNPDRWLELTGPLASADATEDYSSVSKLAQIYMPFLSGPHVCLGQHLAQLQMKIFLATVLKNLTLSPQPNFDMYDGYRITLCPLPGAHLIARKREQK